MMGLDDVPYVVDVWSLRSYECQCPVCNGVIKIPHFKYYAEIRLTGSLIQCRVCATRFFAVKPKED